MFLRMVCENGPWFPIVQYFARISSDKKKLKSGCLEFSSFLLILSPTSPGFLRVCSRSPLKTLWKKEKLLVTSNLSFSHSVFYQFVELSAIFIKFKIVVCKLFQFGRLLKFVVCERGK